MSSSGMSTARGRKPLRRFFSVIGGSVLTLVATVFALLLITFFLNSRSPIDPALAVAGDHASQATYRQTRLQLGLDDPIAVQFARYVGRLARGDLGISRSTGQSVASDLSRAFPATIELATLALLLSTIVGLALALAAASRPGGFWDSVSRALSLVGTSVPVFWFGLLLLALFYARLKLLGGPGRLDDVYQYTVNIKTGFLLFDALRSGQAGAFRNALSHIVLPVAVLALDGSARISRITRSSLLDELSKEYATFARSKGATQRRILLRHALPNVRGSTIIVVALTYLDLLEGAVLTETVFSWPGVGRYLTTALFAADSPAILGTTFALGVLFVLINATVDSLVKLIDPRLK